MFVSRIQRFRLSALLAVCSLVLAACGGSTTATTDRPARTATGENSTTSTIVESVEYARPTGSGGLASVFGSADDAESAAEAIEEEPPLECVGDECDDIMVDGPTEPDEAPPTTTIPHDIASQYQPFCAVLADIEQRPQPDGESAEDFEILRGWLAELASASPGEISAELDRLVDSFDLIIQLVESDADGTDSSAFAQFEQDADRIGRFIDWACFGRGTFDPDAPSIAPPAEDSPATTSAASDHGDPFCLELDALQLAMELALESNDSQQAVSALSDWLDGPARNAPEQILPPLALFEGWYDAMVADRGQDASLDDLMDEDNQPADIIAANEELDEWFELNCDR